MKIPRSLLSLGLIPLVLVGLFLPAPIFQAAGTAGPFSPSARQVLADLPKDGRATFIITLRDQLAFPGEGTSALQAAAALPGKTARQKAVIEALQNHARQQQAGLLAQARSLQARGQVSRLIPFWIFNGVSLEATPAAIRALAAWPEVARVDPDPDPNLPIVPLGGGPGELTSPQRENLGLPQRENLGLPPAPPHKMGRGADNPGMKTVLPSLRSGEGWGVRSALATSLTEPNVTLVNAPALWSLGYTGQGVVIASLDTGVDATHPDLAPSYRGGNNSWYDPYGQNATPFDSLGHGTMTMGLMVGGSAGGTAIGIAPGAKWISAKIFDNSNNATLTAIHQAYQWVLNPNYDPSNPGAPDVVNNSWGIQNRHSCDNTFQLDIQALLAAGVLPVFSAGNFGPGPQTDVSPANNLGAFAVGAVDNNDAIAYFSSRGPGACNPALPFPYLVAPGMALKSTYLSGLYNSCTGTSCSAPEVSGSLALLLSAIPHLSLNLQQEALVQGAHHLTPTVPDSAYGYGRLDVLQAYNWLTTPLVVPNNLQAAAVSPGQIDLTWVDTNSNETGYEVQRSPDGQAGWVSIATTATDATSYNDSNGLFEGSPYFYRVRAVNTSLGYNSNFDTASATTPLLAPTSFTATAVSSSQVNLSWVNNSLFAGGTRVQRSPDGASGWATLGIASAGATTFSDSAGLVEGSPYYYRVQTVNAAQTLASLYTNTSAVTLLLAPGGLVAAPISNTQVNLFWTNYSTHATAYEVQSSLDGLSGWQTLTATLPGTATSYSDTNLTPGKLYYYQVRATGAVPGSESPFTPPAHAVTGPNWAYVPLITR